MAKIESHPPGQFCWAELGTTNMGAAKDFYCALLSWTVVEAPMGPDSIYYTFLSDGNSAAAGYNLSKELQGQGVPPHWLPYVAVENAAATAAKAVELGGTVLAGPFDVMEYGAMAVIRDPQGAVFAVWQPKKSIGSTHGGVDFRHCWTELATTDIAAARDFYTKLFGWTTHVLQMDGMEYTQWICSAGGTGGGMQMGKEFGSAPPHWMVYFSVPDCDQSAAQVTSLGGSLCVPPTDIPNVGRFCVCNDAQGAVFSLIHLKMAG